jgi:hypothetical protein
MSEEIHQGTNKRYCQILLKKCYYHKKMDCEVCIYFNANKHECMINVKTVHQSTTKQITNTTILMVHVSVDT